MLNIKSLSGATKATSDLPIGTVMGGMLGGGQLEIYGT